MTVSFLSDLARERILGPQPGESETILPPLAADLIRGEIAGQAVTEVPLRQCTSLARKPLAMRCLEATATFETSRTPPHCYGVAAGNFDGMGMSWGALQWNPGTGTLQALMLDIEARHPGLIVKHLGDLGGSMLDVFRSTTDRKKHIAWAESFQTRTANGSLVITGQPEAAFMALGLQPEVQAAQMRSAAGYYRRALSWMQPLGVQSERAVALLFDIAVQNGSIGEQTWDAIMEAQKAVPVLSERRTQQWEAAVLRSVARLRAEAALPRWRENVLARKMALADGYGIVHRRTYREEDFDIQLAVGSLE